MLGVWLLAGGLGGGLVLGAGGTTTLGVGGLGGGVVTVSVAARVVALPARFVKTARYSYPFSLSAAANESVRACDPAIRLHLCPLLAERSHLTVGFGRPAAVALKLTVAAVVTLSLAGWAVISGARRRWRA